MYKSVHKKNPIKIGEGGKLIWGENEYVLTHTWFSGGKFKVSIYSVFPPEKLAYTEISPGKFSIY
jgi:hypothetical protein